MKRNNKKGSAKVYLIIAIIIVIAIASIFIKLNWRRFKAEASFGFTMAALAVFLLAIIYFVIRFNIRKARKAKEKARMEQLKAENDRLEAENDRLEAENDRLESRLDGTEGKE